jgi:heavy metal translocating P-type ATPase
MDGGVGVAASCAHCGLPVLGRRRDAEGAGPFCCLGCRLASTIAAGPDGARRFLEARLLVSAFLSMGVMEFTLVLYGESAYAADGDPSMGLFRRLGQIAVLLFAFPVLLLLGVPIAKGAWRDLRAGSVRMDGLIALATFAAFGLSAWHTVAGAGEVYYETATMVLVLVMFGRRLEAHAKTQGRDAAKILAESLPPAAHRAGPPDLPCDVDPGSLAAGDLVSIRPGEAVPADVVIVEGVSEVASAHLTGESAPRLAGPGDFVPAGCVNGLGALVAKVERPWRKGGLGQILELLERPLPPTRTMRAVDRIARWLAFGSVLLALAGGIRSALAGGAGAGIRTGLSVLLVACPCALGLATPLAYRAIRTALARRGVLVNDPAALEVARSIDVVVLDKTGTLTDSAAPLRRSAATDAASFERMASLVVASGHAVGRGLEAGVTRPRDLVVVPGSGVTATIQGQECRAGRPDWLDADGVAWPHEMSRERDLLESSRATIVAYAEDGVVRALGARRDELRPGAVEAVTALRGRGIAAEILSGDRVDAVAPLARELAVEARCGLRPADKTARIHVLREQGRRVAMAGDGINDAPALHAADLSIAMGSGTAAARSEAQVEVVNDDLGAIPLLFDGAAALRRVVIGNLAWTFAYNGVALAFAAAGRLHPVIAAAAMVGSSLVVAIRSHRLLGFAEVRS